MKSYKNLVQEDSDAVKEALDQLSEVGWAKKWSSQPDGAWVQLCPDPVKSFGDELVAWFPLSLQWKVETVTNLVMDAIESFGNGIECNNQNAEAYYCRGNVRVALAFRQPTLNQAQQFFLDAAQDFTVGEALVGEEDKPRFVRARERIQIDRETSLYRDFHRHRP
ncbi:Plant specific mitochondrial import receptor subunit TOM20 [Corchorus olitorius]|uniref:Plant specific mitochondrial import receptor subunit TOM20 n=1 Tax=Corchorus olitorius TaxID=93759 RepID=A0A1R3K634_9ROSI|nr:Plant specific mitochondrial import receptor subunit TOM20 [Corchorus olitorius]